MGDGSHVTHAARPQSSGSNDQAIQEDSTSTESDAPQLNQLPGVTNDPSPSMVAIEVSPVPSSQSWLAVPQWLIDSLSSLESSDIVPSADAWEQVWDDAQALVGQSNDVFAESNSFSWLMAGGVAAAAIVYRRSVASNEDKRAWLELSPGLVDDVFTK